MGNIINIAIAKRSKHTKRPTETTARWKKLELAILREIRDLKNHR